jgi:hypothetical protein
MFIKLIVLMKILCSVLETKNEFISIYISYFLAQHFLACI